MPLRIYYKQIGKNPEEGNACIEQKIFHCEIIVDSEKVKREEKAYRPIPVITDFTDADGRDCMKVMCILFQQGFPLFCEPVFLLRMFRLVRVERFQQSGFHRRIKVIVQEILSIF